MDATVARRASFCLISGVRVAAIAWNSWWAVRDSNPDGGQELPGKSVRTYLINLEPRRKGGRDYSLYERPP